MNKQEKIEYIAKHYTRIMHSAAYSVLGDYHEAEDACQETFLKLYQAIDRLEDVTGDKARYYCTVAAKNTAKDMIRKTKHQVPVEEVYDDPDSVSAYDEYPSDTIDMIKDIEELPEKYKTIIRLRCLEQKSAEETAKLLKTSVNTVNSQLHRARKLLQSKWVSAACLTCLLILIGGTFFYKNVLHPTVLHSTEIIEMEEPKMEVANEEVAAEMREDAAGGLSDLDIYDEIKKKALEAVPEAKKEHISQFHLIEESEKEFYFEIEIVYEDHLHWMKLDVDGNILEHTIDEKKAE